jgi:hypothetical protein
MYVTREKEWEALTNVCEILQKNLALVPGKAVVAMISPDYSATAAMHIAHYLSYNGEMLDIVPVEVPYPDEDPDRYRKQFANSTCFAFFPFETVILVEAGVITGGNYNFFANHLIDMGFKVVTVALFENIHSKFQSDVVGFYYDHQAEQLEFYYERDNNHWK